jgi:polar amino acid transport system substrate-binding protein
LTLPDPVGVRSGTTGDFLVQQEFPRSKRKEFKTSEEAAQALIKKRVASVMADSPQSWWLAAQFENQGLITVPILLSDEQLAWAVRKGEAALLDAVNAALDQMINDGTLAQVIKNWIPVSK